MEKVHLWVSELYIYQNARCNNKNYANPLDVFRITVQTKISTNKSVVLISHKLLWGLFNK